MRIIETDGKPIKSWCNDLDDDGKRQAENLSRLPFIHSHVALMPDAHGGYGMPIGGVIACEGVIIPNAVGVDIGCGMLAVKTTLSDISQDDLKKILGILRKTIPVGFNHRKEKQEIPEIPQGTTICFNQMQSASYQLGTLGGGNHFIEIQKGSDGHVWYMIHSGSRNLGKKVAEHYNKLAVQINEAENSSVPKEWELAYMTEGTETFDKYRIEMGCCLDFAQANRERMAKEVEKAFNEVMDGVDFFEPVNIHHNYASLEEHDGKKLWVHRKGATSAKERELGIIPGSQGTASYIVKGKGNSESFKSCSHEAGRKMGRKQAMRSLDLNYEREKLDKHGVLHSLWTQKDLDEAPGAYKDIDEVMKLQEDLVEIVVELKPLAVIKG